MNRGFLLGVDKDPALSLVIPALDNLVVDEAVEEELAGEANAHPRRHAVVAQDCTHERGNVAAAANQAALGWPCNGEWTRIEVGKTREHRDEPARPDHIEALCRNVTSNVRIRLVMNDEATHGPGQLAEIHGKAVEAGCMRPRVSDGPVRRVISDGLVDRPCRHGFPPRDWVPPRAPSVDRGYGQEMGDIGPLTELINRVQARFHRVGFESRSWHLALEEFPGASGIMVGSCRITSATAALP
jgi:hypothetical protein